MLINRQLISLQKSIHHLIIINMEIKTVSKKRKLLSGLDMTQEEFIARVRKAEEGPFYTLEEIKQKMQEWKAQKYGL